MDYSEKLWSFYADFQIWSKIVYMTNTFRKILGLFFLSCALISFAMNADFTQDRRNTIPETSVSKGPPAPPSKKNPSPDRSSKGQLREAMVQSETEIESCYNSYLNTEPQVREGSVVVSWTLTSQGDILSPQVIQADLVDAGLHACLIDLVTRLQLKASDQETMISQKFVFKQRKLSSLEFQ